MVAHVDGVVSHGQGDGPLRLGLDTCLCVCSVCVVVFGLYNILLALTWVHGDGPDLLLDVMWPYMLGGWLDT